MCGGIKCTQNVWQKTTFPLPTKNCFMFLVHTQGGMYFYTFKVLWYITYEFVCSNGTSTSAARQAPVHHHCHVKSKLPKWLSAMKNTPLNPSSNLHSTSKYGKKSYHQRLVGVLWYKGPWVHRRLLTKRKRLDLHRNQTVQGKRGAFGGFCSSDTMLNQKSKHRQHVFKDYS